ncbi:MAG: bifunctional nicotinamidase/pyrazinamidase [Planctomycetia bacterium]
MTPAYRGAPMPNTALVIIDVQNDFCSGGALAVPHAEAILPVVNSLIRDCRRVFFTQDWHPRGHVSFASSHPGQHPFSRITVPYGEQVLWPDHCVENTAGAAFHPALELPPDATVIRKGTQRDIDSYSAFLENDRKTALGLDTLLRQADVGELMLAGLATDFCVLHTALDARTLGYEVTVVESGCRGIDAEGSLAAAWTQMAEAGVRRA